MKHTLLRLHVAGPIVSLVVLLLFPAKAISQDIYYWYKGERIALSPSSEFIGMELLQNDQATQRGLRERGLDERGHFGRDGRMVVVKPQPGVVGQAVAALRREGKIVRSFNAYASVTISGSTYHVIPFDEILVKFKSHLGAAEIDRLIADRGLSIESVNRRGVYRLRSSTQSSAKTIRLANGLYEDGLAEWSEPNFAMQIQPHEDSLYNRQWYLYNVGQIANSVPGVDIRAPHVWWGGNLGDSNIVVAVLDDGIESHEDLPSSRLVSGWTAAWGGGTGTPSTGDRHGEAVAGIIGASHNGIGINGIAPGVKLMPIKIWAVGGFAQPGQIAAAIDTAHYRGADVLSMSWGCAYSNSIETALRAAFDGGRGGKGCVLVASGGNNQQTEFPANIDSVIAVGGVNLRNNAPWDTPGDYGVDVVAPTSGCEYYQRYEPPEEEGLHLCETCLPDSAIVTLDRMWTAGYNATNYTKSFGGTSAAAPQVAAVAALMLSHDPDLTNHEIRYWIRQTATDLGATSWDGEGRLNARAALAAVGADVAPWNWPDTLDPESAGLGRIKSEPRIFTLRQNHPNPFNPTTTIEIEIDRDRAIDLSIFDILGRHVATLKLGVVNAGAHSFEWNASSAPSGVYFCRLRSENTTFIRKVLVSK